MKKEKSDNEEVDEFLKEHNMTLQQAYEHFRKKLLAS